MFCSAPNHFRGLCDPGAVRFHFNRCAAFLLVSVCLGWHGTVAQETGADQPVPPTPSSTAAAARTGSNNRDVSIRELPRNLLQDQKDIWLFPVKLAGGKHIWPAIGIVGATAAFVATDAHSAPPFHTTNSFSGFNTAFSSTNTNLMIAALPAALYGVGWLRKDSYAKNTALLAIEAWADGFLLVLPFKAITARKQPLAYLGTGPYTDSFFNGLHNPIHSGGFFSGHAIAAMAIATVIAHRYRDHRWVPYVAYGLAGAICFSRISTSSHFPGDVVFGGAMGYVISRYLVLPTRN
jgi:membrane-associated phospholipid phosphatase